MFSVHLKMFLTVNKIVKVFLTTVNCNCKSKDTELAQVKGTLKCSHRHLSLVFASDALRR